MQILINKLYHNPLISSLFHTSVNVLKRELKGCHSVLDIGCGPDSPLKYCNVQYSLGVDAFEPYINLSKQKNIHNEYMISKVSDLKFDANSFDAVILIEVLEHLTKEEGMALLEKLENWSRKKVIISTPNGYLPQGMISDNPFQKHRSSWEVDKMILRGYKAYGMAGWKFLRKENDSLTMEDKNSIFATIRFRPKLLWMLISELTQAVTYFLPELAFGVFYVKEIE